MSSGQLILTLFISLLVFGPEKLPMLARHAGKLLARLEHYKAQAAALWQSQLHEQQLQDNLRKAQKIDAIYQQKGSDHD